MKRLLMSVAVLPFLAGMAMAGSPAPLTDQQMDKVTAGFDLFEVDVSDTSSTLVAVNQLDLGPCTDCYLHVAGTAWPSVPGLRSLQVYSQFGP